MMFLPSLLPSQGEDFSLVKEKVYYYLKIVGISTTNRE